MSEGNPTRVLLVDDEPHIRAFLRLVLMEFGAKDIREAGDSPNALLMYQQFQPELVLLDVNMPGEDGLEVLTKIIGLDPEARVVMLTAVASREVVEKCAEIGALNYIRKDTPREQILKALRATWASATEE